MKFALFTASLLVAGCGVSQDLYNAKVNELGKAESELQATRGKIGVRETEIAKLRKDVEQVKKERDDLEEAKRRLAADHNTTSRRLDELEEARKQAEARNAAYIALLAKLKAMISDGKLAVEIRKGKMIVKLSDRILFDVGQTDLKPDGQEALRQVATALREIPDRDFLVAGHTDNAVPRRHGKYASNWELSTARAVEVVKFMQANGVDPRHLGAAGYSEFDPLGDNDSDGTRALNRRIEIVVMPNISELPQLDDGNGTAAAVKSSIAPVPPP
jgi:chemotaxis protein MotB